MILCYGYVIHNTIGQVMRLLRDCRLEDVRRHIVVTISGPLYQGWGDVKALEDLWHFISSAVSSVSGHDSDFGCL